MGLVNKFRKLADKFSWEKVLNGGITREETVIRNRLIPELQAMLANLETEIPVGYQKIEDGKNITFRVGPIEGPTFIRKTDGEEILTADLFKWLNEGTDVKHVLILGEYENKTFPNSLDTKTADNSEVKILASKNFTYPGLEARNWIPLLRNKYQSDIERSFISGMKQYLMGK